MTTLYLRSSGGTGVIGDKFPVTLSTTPVIDVPSSGNGGVNHAVLDLLTATGGSGTAPSSCPTIGGPLSDPGILAWQFRTPPLASAVTISGTISFDLWPVESSMSANAAVRVVLWKQSPDGTMTLIVNSTVGTEMGTSAAQQSWTATPTSTACAIGDVLVLAVYIDDATSTTMGNGYTASLWLNGLEGSNYDSQIRTTETLSFSGLPGGTVVNLLDTASDISGAGSLKAWTDTPGSVVTKSVDTVNSPSFAQWTDSSGGNALSWYTPQVQAITIAGQFTAQFYASISDPPGGYAACLVRVYKTDSDGSNPVQIGQGRSTSLPAGYGLVTARGQINGSLTDGQRILIRVFTASVRHELLQLSGWVAYMQLNDATYTSSLKFPATLTEYSSGPAPTDYWGVAA